MSKTLSVVRLMGASGTLLLMFACSPTTSPDAAERPSVAVNTGLRPANGAPVVTSDPVLTTTVTEFDASYAFELTPVHVSFPDSPSSSTHIMPDGAVLTYPSEPADPEAASITGPASPPATLTSLDGGPYATATSPHPQAPISGSITQCTIEQMSPSICTTTAGPAYALYLCPNAMMPNDAACIVAPVMMPSDSTQRSLCCTRS